MPYKHVLFLLGAVARADGSEAVRAINPFRGRWHETWRDIALQSLDGLGAFSGPSASIEDAVETCVATAVAQPGLPPSVIFTAADYVSDLNWYPGQFGALQLKP